MRPPVRRGVLLVMPVVCIRTTVATVLQIVSGPGGVASFLRRNLMGKGLNGPSLPLDVGQP